MQHYAIHCINRIVISFSSMLVSDFNELINLTLKQWWTWGRFTSDLTNRVWKNIPAFFPFFKLSEPECNPQVK